jgi:hypothetical protein
MLRDDTDTSGRIGGSTGPQQLFGRSRWIAIVWGKPISVCVVVESGE